MSYFFIFFLSLENVQCYANTNVTGVNQVFVFVRCLLLISVKNRFEIFRKRNFLFTVNLQFFFYVFRQLVSYVQTGLLCIDYYDIIYNYNIKQPTLVFGNCDFDLKLTDTEIKTTEERARILYI